MHNDTTFMFPKRDVVTGVGTTAVGDVDRFVVTITSLQELKAAIKF